jgi:primosomal protein N'
MTGSGIYCHRCGEPLRCPNCRGIDRKVIFSDGIQYRQFRCSKCNTEYEHNCHKNTTLEAFSKK